MSINKDHLDNHDLDIFDDDFEVIYEGELPDIPMPEDDNFQDVLSIYRILTAQKILIIWKKTTLLPLIWMKKQRENMKKLPIRKNEKKCRTFLNLWQKLLRPAEKQVQRRSTKRQTYFCGAPF